MSDNDNPQQPGRRPRRRPVPLDQGHVEGPVDPAAVREPGSPAARAPHGRRRREGRRRAEKQVATLFALSMLATMLFIVAYFAIPNDLFTFVPDIGETALYNVVLGVTLGVTLLCIGVGAVHWAKTLMPDEEIVEERHPQASSDASRQGAVEGIYAGVESAQLRRRPLIKYTLGGALGLFAVPLVLQIVGGPGPLPGSWLSTTMWRKGLASCVTPRCCRSRP